MSSQPSDNSTPLIVGIGASAGGLAAFKQFFAEMPVKNGMAFILVQHLDPKHDSLLVSLIGKQTSMTVVEASDGTVPASDTIYIIPPDATLTIQSGALRVTKPAPPRDLRRPIDTFFRSLAEEQGDNAVCIVLSGTGSDGTLGLRAVKEHGGLTLAQAEFDHHAMSGMPGSAAATGQVDLVLPVEAMAARLIAHHAFLIDARLRMGDSDAAQGMAAHLTAISEIVRAATGQNICGYKASTVTRRMQRRMQVLQVNRIADYVERLRRDKDEAEALFREILIGVTQFFRDTDAFEALRINVIEKLVAGKSDADQIRVWVAGCSSGEEAYSIAILLREAIERAGSHPRIQIFGSDIDDKAVARARVGRFRGPLDGVSASRLARWFTVHDGVYSVSKEIREMCTFSTHSLDRDPPFSKLQLVSCRNVQIYFDRALQERVIKNFHYALSPGGFLFLGQSEGVVAGSASFAVIDKQHRIYQWRRGAAGPSLPEFPLAAIVPRQASKSAPTWDDPIENSVRRIVADLSPAFVVIDKNFQVLRFSGGDFGQYLEPSAGVASLDLFAMLRKSLCPPVRVAVRNARNKRGAASVECRTSGNDGVLRNMVISATPLARDGPEAELNLVAFVQGGSLDAVKRGGVKERQKSSSPIAQMERDLAVAQMALNDALKELESTTEEMKSSNEEYHSVNEELQASNEELETAKEEMQSINEELRTVNAEISDKNDQLQRLNSDLRNLLDSTQIATMFLDAELKIKSFTPGMMDLIHLRDGDIGRPVTELVSRLSHDNIEQDVRGSLEKLHMVEREVRTAATGTTPGMVLLMRVRPYRTVKNVVDGVVITFFDITSRKRLEDALKESERRLSAIISQAAAGVAESDFQGRFTLSNPLFCRIAGRTKGELSALCMNDILHPDDIGRMNELVQGVVATGQGADLDLRLMRPDGSFVWVHDSVSPTLNADGQVNRILMVVVDINDQKLAEAHRELLLHELSHRVKNTLATVQSIARQTSPGANTVEEYRSAFMSRLLSLGRTHNLLQTSDWHGALLRDVVLSELAPYRTDCARWKVDGPDVLLDSNSALALGMAVHELVTNAAKYGALSVGGGLVTIGWTADMTATGRLLRIQWNESGGPVVGTTRKRGFGSRLITDGLALQLDGKIALEFKEAGVSCSIEAMLPREKVVT